VIETAVVALFVSIDRYQATLLLSVSRRMIYMFVKNMCEKIVCVCAFCVICLQSVEREEGSRP
jgi:hypothetical protein